MSSNGPTWTFPLLRGQHFLAATENGIAETDFLALCAGLKQTPEAIRVFAPFNRHVQLGLWQSGFRVVVDLPDVADKNRIATLLESKEVVFQSGTRTDL